MKTLCIYHSRDLDGWMSAAIVKKDYTDHVKAGKYTSLDSIDFLGWDYGDEVPIDIQSYDRVVMTDISFPVEVMSALYHNLSIDFIWIDHHVSAIKENDNLVIKGSQDTKYAACELTWNYFFPNETMPEIVRLLGRYDCFGHKGTEEEQKVLLFQYACRANLENMDDCYKALNHYLSNEVTSCIVHIDPIEGIISDGKQIYNYLCTEAKQTYSKAFPIEFYEPLTTEEREHDVYEFLCVNQERFNPINFGIDYHKDGYDGFACFWYKDGKWNFSLYNDNGEVDCSAIAKSFGGGGHKGASGFVVEDLSKVF